MTLSGEIETVQNLGARLSAAARKTPKIERSMTSPLCSPPVLDGFMCTGWAFRYYLPPAACRLPPAACRLMRIVRQTAPGMLPLDHCRLERSLTRLSV